MPCGEAGVTGARESSRVVLRQMQYHVVPLKAMYIDYRHVTQFRNVGVGMEARRRRVLRDGDHNYDIFNAAAAHVPWCHPPCTAVFFERR